MTVTNSMLINLNKKYKFLLNNITNVIIETELDGTLTYVSPQVRDQFGYKPENVIGENFLEFIHTDDISIVKKALMDIIKFKKIFSVECRVKHKAGHYIPVSVQGNFVEVEYTLRLVGTLRDISEKKMAIKSHKNIERQLKTSEIKYRTIFEQIVDSIILIDSINGEIVDFNEQMHKTLGYTRDEFEKLRIPDFDLMENEEDYKTYLEKVVNIGSDSFETKYITKTGEIKDILVKVKAIEIEDKIFLHSIIRDITKERQVKKQTEEINTLKSELLKRTSHKLKTPLISIIGFTDLLLELHRDKFDTEIISILDEIKHGTERLEAIINKLLETSLLESGYMLLNPKKEDLSFLIKFCVRNLRGLAETRNQFIYLNIYDKIILDFEKEKIHEVISHLIINALKFTPSYGEIKIQTDFRDDFAVFSVKDNGIGFTKEEKKKIFKKFGKIERYGQGWNIGIEGTGMGLYTSKKIVELHGGEIWVESSGRNNGSKFSFTLPLKRE